jgi:acetyl-CoA carboxylase carboxyl transferase subunit beta
MSWFTKLRNKVTSLTKRDTPDNLWVKCRNCSQMIFAKDFQANLCVCTNCNHHERIRPSDRFAQIFDDGTHRLVDIPDVVTDPLKFRDSKKYVDRLKDARAATDARDAVAVATGTIGGHDAVIAVQDFSFMGGSMGMAVGEAFITAVRTAVERRSAFIMFTAAGGARMQEGILSLMQMPRTTVAIEELRESGLPYIVVLTDPTTGGVTASYAMLGDIHIAEPGALIGFAGQRVIENTIREKLPDGFQRSEYLRDHGMVDLVVARKELRNTLATLLALLKPVSPVA